MTGACGSWPPRTSFARITPSGLPPITCRSPGFTPTMITAPCCRETLPFMCSIAARACRSLRPAARLMMTLPDTLLFFGHAAGPLIQNALLKAALDAGDSAAEVPYIEVADRFGVSRTHVRYLMNSGSGWSRQNRRAWRPKHLEILPRSLGELRPRSGCWDVSSRRRQPRRDEPVDEGAHGCWRDGPARSHIDRYSLTVAAGAARLDPLGSHGGPILGWIGR